MTCQARDSILKSCGHATFMSFMNLEKCFLLKPTSIISLTVFKLQTWNSQQFRKKLKNAKIFWLQFTPTFSWSMSRKIHAAVTLHKFFLSPQPPSESEKGSALPHSSFTRAGGWVTAGTLRRQLEKLQVPRANCSSGKQEHNRWILRFKLRTSKQLLPIPIQCCFLKQQTQCCINWMKWGCHLGLAHELPW